MNAQLDALNATMSQEKSNVSHAKKKPFLIKIQENVKHHHVIKDNISTSFFSIVQNALPIVPTAPSTCKVLGQMLCATPAYYHIL